MTSVAEGSCAKLRLSFDPERLKQDLATLSNVPQIRQPGTYHGGEWVGISLRSAGGRPSARPSLPSLEPFRDTAVLARAPYFQEVLRTLRVPQLCVRVLFLPPRGIIRQHTDDLVGFWHGLVRLHIPIVTHPDVRFMIGGSRCYMAPGELWYGDFSQNHSVVNESSATRVHIVVDVLINQFLLELFPPAFVEEHAGEAVTCYREPLQLSRHKLKRYVCTFYVPPQLVAMFAPVFRFDASPSVQRLADEASRTGVLAEIRLVNGEIYAAANGRTIVRLVPITEDACALAEWPLGIMLHFQRLGENVSGLALELRTGSGPNPRSDLIPLRLFEP